MVGIRSLALRLPSYLVIANWLPRAPKGPSDYQGALSTQMVQILGITLPFVHLGSGR